jgi:hypothetical protein
LTSKTLTQLVGAHFDWGKTGDLVRAMTEVNDLLESPFPRSEPELHR